MFVAVAVDLGNAYYARRTAQNAADGAALAGVSRLATGINNETKLDGAIKEDMNDFAERNGIADSDTTDTEVNDNVEGWYVDTSGNRLSGEPMVGDGTVPEGAYGVEAITYITATAFFGGIFGIDGYPVQARAVSLLKQACSAECVVPITTDVSLLLTDEVDEDGNPIPNIGACFNIWRENQNEVPTPGLYGWVNWTWQDAMCELEDRPCPSVDQKTNSCDSTTLAANLNPSECASGFVEVGDWMSSTSGVINADDVLCWLCYYLGPAAGCEASPCLEPTDAPVAHEFIIPVYDTTNLDQLNNAIPCKSMTDPEDPSSGGLHYRVAGFARMQLLGFQLSQGTSESVSAGDSGTGCVTLGTGPHEGNRITAQFLEYVQDFDTSSACYDPEGTLLSAPKLTE
jgi:hypothetical protein